METQCKLENLSRHSNTLHLSLVRVFCIYWVVLIQHNMAPFSNYWGWVSSEENLNILLFYPGFASATKYISWLTMPLCFFVSGYVLRITNGLTKRNFRDFVYNKVSRILLPCVVFGIFFQIIKEGRLTYESLTGYFHLWFLWYLFLFFVLSKIFKIQLIPQKWFVGILLILFVLPTVLFHMGMDALSGFTKYYMFFLFGFVAPFFFNYLHKKMSALGLIIFLLVFIAIDLNFGCGDKDWFVRLYGFVIVPLIVYLLSFANALIGGLPKFSFFDRYSYGVYIFHAIILFLIYAEFAEIVDFGSCGFGTTSLIAFLTIPLSIGCTFFFKKYFKMSV